MEEIVDASSQIDVPQLEPARLFGALGEEVPTVGAEPGDFGLACESDPDLPMYGPPDDGEGTGDNPLLVQAAEGLALAVGLDVAKQHINLHRMTLHPGLGVNALDTQIEGWSDLNFTPSFGVMFRPDEKLSLGANYHFKKTMKFDEGEATLTPVAPGADPWGNARRSRVL